jgi:hypothetical protein
MERRLERRRSPRLRTLKAARILLNQHRSALDCTVRNLTQIGACLTVPSTVGIPDRFDVIFESDHSMRACRMIWHKEKQIGVEFASDARPLTTSS